MNSEREYWRFTKRTSRDIFYNIFFDEFFLIFISSLFLSFLLGGFSNKRKRESARGQIFFSSFEHNKKRKNTCSVCAVKVAQTCDIKTDHQNRRRARFLYPPRQRFLLCTWSRFDISTRARGIYFIMVLFSFFFLWFWVTLFLFSSRAKKKTIRGGAKVSRFWSFQKKRRREEEIFFCQRCFLSSLFFSSLFYSLFSLRAREHLSSNLLPSYFNNAP